MRRRFPYLETCHLLCEEELWPFRPNSLDLIVSNLSLHLSNDAAAACGRQLDSLRADGILLGHTYGRHSLAELRSALYLAENERSGGFASHAFQ